MLVIAALSALAYVLVDSSYRDLLAPALDTVEGRTGFARAMQHVAFAILAIDGGLVLLVGAASYALARAAVHPLALAREREERFAADAAHELRTPLGVIASVAQAAKGGGGTQDNALDTIVRHALDASTLVSDLLTLARRDDTTSLLREPVDLAATVIRAADELRETAHEHGVELDVKTESAIVDGDERRLMQLARNLLRNAVQHARSRVEARVHPQGEHAVFAVWDDGAGVDGAVRPRLFERFAKGPDSKGSGLGLAICRWVARSHGGDCALVDDARFVARLPLGNYSGLDRVEAAK